MVDLLLLKIQHIGIPVTDLSRSIGFYQNLGFQTVLDSPFDHGHGQGRCVMMKQAEILIELYQFPAEVLESIKWRRDGKIDHIAFDVPDIGEVFQQLKALGFIPLEEQPVFLPFWEHGCRYFNILGPDGERLEFNQILR